MHLTTSSLEPIGYFYNNVTDKWTISDGAADYIYTGDKVFDFALPGTLQVICNYTTWQTTADKTKYHPLLQQGEIPTINNPALASRTCFLEIDVNSDTHDVIAVLKTHRNIILVVHSHNVCALQSIRAFLSSLMEHQILCPVILKSLSKNDTVDEQLIHFATETGGLLLDGFGDGVWLVNINKQLVNTKVSGRTYIAVNSEEQLLNNTAFSILQATRTRISKTEYISCPSCGRTLFDLQETTAKIRAATSHLKGIKIAIMGCIVNGPGEMADADFGYVGSGPGKITLYKGKEVVRRNVPSDTAVDALIQLLKENDAWVYASDVLQRNEG